MKRKQIKAALAAYDYTMIKPSWHSYKGAKCAIFIAYNKWGMCHQFYISGKTKTALRTLMTDVDIRLEPADVTYMFFEEV